jgi:hypothetical protein
LTYERHIRQESQEFRNLAHIDPLFAVSSPARAPPRDSREESVGFMSSSYQSSEAPLAYQSTPQPYSPGESHDNQRLLLAPLEDSSKCEEEEAVMDLTLSNQSEEPQQPGASIVVLDQAELPNLVLQPIVFSHTIVSGATAIVKAPSPRSPVDQRLSPPALSVQPSYHGSPTSDVIELPYEQSPQSRMLMFQSTGNAPPSLKLDFYESQ